MRKQIILLLLFITPLSFTTNLYAQEEQAIIPRDTLISLVEKYYDLNLIIFQANSTVQDIDHVFELFTDDFTYVHPKYGGVYTRQVLYDGYVRNQKAGGYDGGVVNIKVVNKIVGLNAVVVERKYVEKKEDRVEDGEPQMTLFEFKEGKISKIFEYW